MTCGSTLTRRRMITVDLSPQLQAKLAELAEYPGTVALYRRGALRTARCEFINLVWEQILESGPCDIHPLIRRGILISAAIPDRQSQSERQAAARRFGALCDEAERQFAVLRRRWLAANGEEEAR